MLEKLRVFIAEQLNVDESEIGPDTSFHDDLGADSLDLYELAMKCKEASDKNVHIIMKQQGPKREPLSIMVDGYQFQESVLYRTAESDKDYRGGHNNFSSINNLIPNIIKMFDDYDRYR